MSQRISRWKISIIAPIRLILATAASASRLKIVAFIPARWHSHWLWWAVALDLLFYQWFSVANHKPAQISLVWTTGSMKRTYGFYDSYVFIHFLVGFNNETLLSSTFRECNFESHQRHNKNGRALKKNVEIDEWSWVITEGHRFVRNTFFWFDCVVFLREFSLTTPPPPFHFLPLAPILLFLISIFLASTPLLSKNLSIVHQGGSATNQSLNKAELALPGSWTSYSAGPLLDVVLSVCLSVLLPHAM